MNSNDPPASPVPRPSLLWPLVTVGIAAISFASILIRLAEAPALSIATYRVALAALAMGPFFVRGQSAKKPHWSRGILCGTLLSGCFLALHFAFWIGSLQRTSIASSVSLASTTPLFVAFFSYCWHRRKPALRLSLGILCTIAGSLLVAGTDFALSRQALLGDLLALIGAVMAAGYLMAGQYVRASLDVTSYTFGAYGTAALVLATLCLLFRAPLAGFSRETYWVLILLALVPQLIGHTTFNWTLRFLPPAGVSLLILGEPIGASLLAYAFFGETVAGWKGPGLFFLGLGIVLGSSAFQPGKSPSAGSS